MAPEGWRQSSASSSAAKGYLNSQLTGFNEVPAQQKGSGMWSGVPARSPQKGVMGWLCLCGGGFSPEVLGKHCSLSLHQHGDFGGVCWAKLPCSICPGMHCIRRASPACVLSLAGKRQSGLQVITNLEIEYMCLCICNCLPRTLRVRK